MPARLLFPDADAAADALTFAGRAAAIEAEAGLRIVASSGVLVMTTGVLSPRGLLDTMPTILAMRVLPVDAELVCDVTVAATTLQGAASSAEVTLPETAMRAAWAGVTPPRTGWVRHSSLASSVLASRSQWGMAAVAHELPVDPGEDAVRAVRARIWGAADADLDGLPRGIAFAAVSMGFVHGEEDVPVLRAPGWTRLTLRRGHVLVRGPVRDGLTEVRSTGR